jgi:hypothetical protein
MAMTKAVVQASWRPQRGQPWWERRWLGPLVLGLALLLLAYLLPTQWPVWLTMFSLCALGWLWWCAVAGILAQNRPELARLLPGHISALRSALMAQSALVALAAFGVLSAAFGPRLEWLWWIGPVMLLIAWAQREPWLWLLTILSAIVPWRQLAVDAQALPVEVQALALLIAAGTLVAVIGQGGRLHRWYDTRARRWRRAAQASRAGRATSPALHGAALRALLWIFDWPMRLWRRHTLARGAAAPLAARLDLGLGLGGQWAELLWVAVLLFGGVGILLFMPMLGQYDLSLVQVVDNGRYGLCIGVFVAATSAFHERLSRLWARRPEQALLALLPGPPAADLSLLEARWRRESLIRWAVATVLVLFFCSFGGPGSVDYAAACAALCLPLMALAQHLQRRIVRRPRPWLLWLAAPLAALLAVPVPTLGVPAWFSLGLAAAVTVWLLRRPDPLPLRLPVGRGH